MVSEETKIYVWCQIEVNLTELQELLLGSVHHS